MSGTKHALYNLLLLLFMRVVMGIRFPEPVATIFGVVLGSLFPDTDIIGSRDSLFPIMKIYQLRKYLHSIFFLLVSLSISFLIHKGFGAGFLIGYGFHLIQDKMVYKSLPYIWYPYRTKQTSDD